MYRLCILSVTDGIDIAQKHRIKKTNLKHSLNEQRSHRIFDVARHTVKHTQRAYVQQKNSLSQIDQMNFAVLKIYILAPKK